MIKIFVLGLLLWLPLQFSAQANSEDLEAYFSAMIVNNIDSSISWYTDVLGFVIENRMDAEARGFRQANLSKRDILIELIELDSAISPQELIPEYSNKTRMIGLFKTGFRVGDFSCWIDIFNKKKANFHGSVVTDQLTGKRMVIIKDPDGNRIQLFEK